MKQRVWKRVRLDNYCSKIGSGSTPRGGEMVYQSDGIALIRSQNVYNGLFTTEGLAFIGEEEATKLAGVTVEKDDVLLNITGDSVARCCQVPESVLPARVNQHVAIIRAERDEFDPRFLKYFFISPYMQATMLSLAGSGGTRKALTKEMIQNFDVPKPALSIQVEISEVLSSYDELIGNNRRRMELLEHAARLLYQEWFVRLRFPGHEHTPLTDGVPQGWQRVPFEDALVLQRGFDLPESKWEEGDFPICGSTGIIGYHKEAKVKGPGVFTGRSGSLGVVNYVDEDYWPHNTTLWVREFKKVTPLFGLFLMRGMNLKQYNGGASVPTLDRKAVHRVTILIPNRKLIALFDEQLAPMFSQLRNLREQNRKLRAARDLLLPHLMSGEIAI
jgi:type I restriction enzyme, S subunit